DRATGACRRRSATKLMRPRLSPYLLPRPNASGLTNPISFVYRRHKVRCQLKGMRGSKAGLRLLGSVASDAPQSDVVFAPPRIALTLSTGFQQAHSPSVR